MYQRFTPPPPHIHAQPATHGIVCPSLYKGIVPNCTLRTLVRRSVMLAMLIFASAVAHAQNLTVTLNDTVTKTAQPTLEAAVTASGLAANSVVRLQISGGSFTAADWLFLPSLSNLTEFTITAGVTSVENHPNTATSRKLPKKLERATIHKLTTISNLFASCSYLTEISCPDVIQVKGFSSNNRLHTLKLPKLQEIDLRTGNYNFPLTTYLHLGATPPTVRTPLFYGAPSPRFLKLVDTGGQPLTGDALATAIAAYKNVNDGDVTDNLWYGWQINETPADLAIMVNGQATQYNGRLDAAIATSGFAPADVTELEIAAGSMTGYDYWYMSWQMAVSKLTLSNSDTILNNMNGALPTAGAQYIYALKELIAPNVKMLNATALRDYYNLEHVHLPALRHIGQWALSSNYALRELNLPCVTTVDDNALRGLTNLGSIALPQCTSIGVNSIAVNGSLTFIKLGGLPPTIGSGTFSSLPSPRYLQLVDAAGQPLTGDALATAIAAYKAVDDGDVTDNLWHGWRINETPPSIKVKINLDNTVYEGQSLDKAIATSSIDVGSITRIEVLEGELLGSEAEYIRNNLFNLERLIISSEQADFSLNLKGATIMEFHASKIRTIGPSAFMQCGMLQSVTLNMVESLASDAFFACNQLVFISMPKLNSIGHDALKGCSKLSLMQLGATPPSVTGSEPFSADPSPRFLQLVDTTGQPLTGDALTTAIAAYKAVDDGDVTDDLWYGWTLSQPTIMAVATPAMGGTVSGGGSYSLNSTVTLQAMPNEGFRFVRWIESDTTASTDNPFTFECRGNRSLTAEFEHLSYQLAYTADANGSITGSASQTVLHGESGSAVTAVANAGFRFKQWSDGRTDNPRIDSNVTADLSVTAVFEVTTGLRNSALEPLSLYPNPTQGVLWVSVPELAEGTAAEVHVYNANGQLLQRVPAHGASAGSAASRLSIDLSAYPAGMYIIRVGNAVAKVVKQ